VAQGVFPTHIKHFGIGVGIVRLWCISTGGVACGFTCYGGSNLVLVVRGCWCPELDSRLIVQGHAEYVKEWVQTSVVIGYVVGGVSRLGRCRVVRSMFICCLCLFAAWGDMAPWGL
jgi:hypothetical protein